MDALRLEVERARAEVSRYKPVFRSSQLLITRIKRVARNASVPQGSTTSHSRGIKTAGCLTLPGSADGGKKKKKVGLQRRYGRLTNVYKPWHELARRITLRK